MMASDAVYGADQPGCVHAEIDRRASRLSAGEVGFIIAGIKELQAAKVGDTITLEKKLPNNPRARRDAKHCRVSREIQPQVFAGLFPTEASEYDQLRDALEKLKLNDSPRCSYEPEVSQALGFGFRCGFLGLLHMEIVQERLEREFDQDLITTAPSASSTKLQLNDGSGDPSRQPVEDARPWPHCRDSRADRARCTSTCRRITSAR